MKHGTPKLKKPIVYKPAQPTLDCIVYNPKKSEFYIHGRKVKESNLPSGKADEYKVKGHNPKR